jgi:hypothetical protein
MKKYDTMLILTYLLYLLVQNDISGGPLAIIDGNGHSLQVGVASFIRTSKVF